MDDLLSILQAVAAAAALLIPALWRTSAKLQKIESGIETLQADIKSKIDALEADGASFSENALKTADVEREGRKELWKELSQIRERMVKIETKMNGDT